MSTAHHQSLEATQRAVSSVIMNPLTPEFEASSEFPDGRSAAEIANTLIKPTSELAGFDRLSIYNRQYWFRLIDCLYDDFPGLRAILGRTVFNRLVVEYLVTCPSQSYSLRDLGGRLPGFIADNPQLTARRYKAAQDLAQFEWAKIVAFDGPSLAPLTESYLSCTSPEQLRVCLQPHLTLLQLRYPFDEFLSELRRTESARSEASSGFKHRNEDDAPIALPRARTVYVAVHRHENGVYYKRLEEPAFRLLTSLQQGRSLAESCEEFLPSLSLHKRQPAQLTAEQIQEKIRRWFSTWAYLQWLCPSYGEHR